MKVKSYSLIVVFFLVLLTACSNISTSTQTNADQNQSNASTNEGKADNKVFKLRFSDYQAPQHILYQNMTKPWIEQVEKESDGRIEIEYFGASQMGGMPDQLALVQRGTADIANVPNTLLQGKMPLSSIVTLPINITSSEVATLAFQDIIYNEDLKLLKNDFLDNNIQHLYGVYLDAYNIYNSKRPIRNYEDIDGLSIKSAGGYYSMALEAIGAIPVNVPPSDTYIAVQQGTVDGYSLAISSVPGYNLPELTKYATFGFDIGSNYLNVVINKEVWDSLPDDLKEIIEKANQDMSIKAAKFLDKYNNDILTEFTEDYDIEISNLSDEDIEKVKDNTQSVIEQWIDDMDEKGLEGEKVYDYFLERMEHYSSE